VSGERGSRGNVGVHERQANHNKGTVRCQSRGGCLCKEKKLKIELFSRKLNTKKANALSFTEVEQVFCRNKK